MPDSTKRFGEKNAVATPVTAKTWSWLISVLASWLNVVGLPPSSSCVLVVDLAPVHAALGVDVLEVGLLAVDQRREVRRQGSRLGRDRPDRDGVRGHPRRGARSPTRPLRRPPGPTPWRPSAAIAVSATVAISALNPCLTSHAVPNHLSWCIPPGMPVTVAKGLHAHCSTPSRLARRFTSLLHSPMSRSSHGLVIVGRPVRQITSYAQFKKSLCRSNSRSARTSSGRTAASSSTSRATSGS